MIDKIKVRVNSVNMINKNSDKVKNGISSIFDNNSVSEVVDFDCKSLNGYSLEEILSCISKTGDIDAEDIDFSRIATSSYDASKGIFLQKVYLDAWKSGDLNYEVKDNKTILIKNGDVPMGYTDFEGIRAIITDLPIDNLNKKSSDISYSSASNAPYSEPEVLENGNRYVSNTTIYDNAYDFYNNVNYDYYLSTSDMSDPNNYGECPWFAQGRAKEIVDNSNMTDDRKEEILNLLTSTRPHGGLWYDTLKDSMLNSSTDIYEPKPGSIITWASSGKSGHVGIIEDVEYDSSGNVSKVLLTESWNGTNNPSNAKYQCSWKSIDEIKKYTGHNHDFVGYTYLLD